MDELPKLRLIHSSTDGHDVAYNCFERTLQRCLRDYPEESVGLMLEALVDYANQLETDVHSDAIYISLYHALSLWQGLDD
jgi:hypothetical protein